MHGDSMIGQTISHYRVLQRLGAGGMGTVFLAEDTRLHRKVALKFIAEQEAAGAEGRARLLREAETASALDHPHIATIFEIGEANGQLFIAMAYYPGETLQQRLARGPLAIEEAVALTGQAAEGLAAAHAAGIVHRDLKPGNLVITPSHQVKILDFGLAKQVTPKEETRSALTDHGVTVGTLAYMSPEQARAEEVGPASDVWSLGVVLFQMLTGRLPFRGTSSTAVLAALLTEPVPPIRSLRPEVPPELARLVERSLEKDPARRTLTAAEIAGTLRNYHASVDSPEARSWWRTPRWMIPLAVAVLLAVVAASVMWIRGTSRRRWARAEALPEIARLAEAQRFAAAMDLARRTEAILPNEAKLAAAWDTIARPFTILTEPAGATISCADYGMRPTWFPMATSPAQEVRFPRGPIWVRIEKAGYETLEDVAWTGPTAPSSVVYSLVPAGSSPPGMVRAMATAGTISTFVFGLELPRVHLDAFWIDRTEVSNRDYKAFVDAGGYRHPEFWTEPFVEGGRILSRDEAMRRFLDATGRPGPAGWELGTYPSGEDELPVRGVSWYEAAAFAAWSRKSLPTIYHWSWVASLPLTGFVIPIANLQGSGPLPVTMHRTVHRFGAYDLAGNVKEWMLNDTGSGKRYILGGGWDEPPYMFADADARSPFDRETNFGFRCVRYDEGDTSVSAASRPALPPSRDYIRERPVSDEVFEAYKRLYSYDRTDLAARVETVDDGNPDWRRETVTFAAAYGQERVKAYIYLPRRAARPYQTVVFMPGAGAWDQRSSDSVAATPPFAFLVRSGRAVVFPLYKGTYERGSDAFRQDVPKASSLWRDYTICFYKDLARTLDYMETRPEFERERFAYLGQSRGSALAPLLLAIEPRIRTAVLWLPGLYSESMQPEVDVVHFLPRTLLPTLVLSGKYDYNFPDETSSRPFFERLGTPADRKRRVVYDTGHNLPQNEAVKETLDWLDRELGPVGS